MVCTLHQASTITEFSTHFLTMKFISRFFLNVEIYVFYAADQVADIGKRIMDQLGGKQFYYTTSYLEAWIKKRYEQCALTSQYLSEVVAVVEHHILFEAKALMFVQGDSWSSRVMNDRKLVGKFTRPGDKSLLDVLTNFIVGQPQMKMNPMTKQELKKRLAELKYP